MTVEIPTAAGRRSRKMVAVYQNPLQGREQYGALSQCAVNPERGQLPRRGRRGFPIITTPYWVPATGTSSGHPATDDNWPKYIIKFATDFPCARAVSLPTCQMVPGHRLAVTLPAYHARWVESGKASGFQCIELTPNRQKTLVHDKNHNYRGFMDIGTVPNPIMEIMLLGFINQLELLCSDS